MLIDRIDALFDHIKGIGNISSDYIQNLCIYFLSIAEKCIFDTSMDHSEIFDHGKMVKRLLEFHSIEDIHDWMVDVFTQFSDKMNVRKNNKNRIQIAKVVAFVSENYNKDISLKDVAQKIYLTPNYIGNIFKCITGESFTDYLTRIRMEKAKELLSVPENRISEVSDAIGYSNIAYFCTRFKNMYGVSPSEFREFLFRNSTN
jgi:two-component system response regulator YesN